jgi:hypothetical protein
MGHYIESENRNALAKNLARLYTLEELAVLKVSSRENWLSSPEPSVIRDYAWTTYSCIDDALMVKMQEAYDLLVNPPTEKPMPVLEELTIPEEWEQKPFEG